LRQAFYRYFDAILCWGQCLLTPFTAYILSSNIWCNFRRYVYPKLVSNDLFNAAPENFLFLISWQINNHIKKEKVRHYGPAPANQIPQCGPLPGAGSVLEPQR
jgi:hypothetical protein